MTQAQLLQAPDLRHNFPRSPNDTLGDYVLLPRIIDKCRALIAGTNGEYNYDCPLDQRFFGFTGIDAQAFKAQVSEGKTDEALLAWVTEQAPHLTSDAILAWSYEMRWSAPTDPPSRALYERLRRQIAPDKPYLQTWPQLLDAEEHRI